MTNYQSASGVPEESVGSILQRGGEELALEKVSDRFTVRPTSQAADVTQSVPAEPTLEIPKADLQEFIVDPSGRDKAMQAARASEDVAFASHVYQLKENPQTLVYLTDQVTIQFAPSVEEETRNAIASEHGLQLLKPVNGIPNTFVFHLTPQATENPVKIANRLMGRKEVLTAEPNIVVRQEQHYRPKDSLYPQQWYLNNAGANQVAASSHISVEKAWDITRGVRSVVVAVTDDGFDLNHPDFQGAGKIVAPKDFKDQDFLPLSGEEDENHGTACAGVAVAEETGSGIVGVAPGCAFMPLRTTGFLDDESIEQLFEWAIQNGASVISCSWGPAAVYFPLSLRQRAALTRAATIGRDRKGCVIVFAAGNANRPISGTINEQGWPNNLLKGPTQWLGGFTVHPDVITVSACTSLSKKSAYSNWGNVTISAPSNNAPPGMWFEQTGYISTAPEVRTALPGLGVLTADRLGAAGYSSNNFTNDFGGTSSACPVVAGVAALVLSANPDLTAQEVRRILQQTADKIVDPGPDPQLAFRLGTYDVNGYSQWFGYGKVNAFKAVQAAKEQRVQQSKPSQVLNGRNNNSLAIPDDNPQGITSPIQVPQTGSVRDIQIGVNIEHSFLGDIEVSLIPPTGQTVLLQGRTLGSATQLQGTYTLQNTPALKQLLASPAAGVWHLLVVDYAQLDTGTVKSWELTLGI
ncbi:S8 family serine peptidase [Funiculus sociatus GB2-A5]|uniref:S8 family serine peptidase n=1 Tax=Funiculus sociatus GB2-A5 TaxID=2933946 RepID=A0ABV0JJ43_9CYAN|nr:MULTISPECIES: S8 family serine peptidase [unclassified Trichocoleus]MBD1908625.1 S8 family serine peptidase [Trichocoleus sp. FACHB-832]MBD2063246.1 S8 family serine peptidase [Trichocoleus sp. FACHB-6]